MQRHRGLFLGFALSALLGLMGNQAQAGLITVTITLSGATVEQVTSTSTTAFTVDTVALDSKLGALGSIYTFTNLAVTSSNPSALPAFLQTNAQVTEIAGTNTEAVVITVTQSGFLAPTGPGGVLESSAAGNSSPSTGGSSSFVSSYNTTNATALVQSGTTSMGSNSTSIGTIPVTGYSLNNSFTIGFTGTGASQGVTGTASINTSAIPEPASVVMLLTGMPLPLAIVFGLIRRRRAEA